ncbi:LCP family protein [Salinibacterium sp. G-O1]|uniref:LCP family protein n=1 Tax=Salinibacterium sp. G-O1 TaxID=3046208 RepID=UPI0024B9B5D3|nr:LCP family protein [Salinibacterium sp. G-O1]MDJ0336505.1 LCP family protein [Salinibacterium sp. G-O1]
MSQTSLASAYPVRYPDAGSQPVMTRRAWVLVVMNVLIPGSAQLLAGNKKLGRFGVSATFVLWALVIVGGLTFVLAQAAFISVATNYWALWVVQVLLVFYIVLWVVLTLDTVRLIRLVRVGPRARGFVAGVAVLALVATGGTVAYGAMVAGVTRSTVDSIFSGGQIEDPVDGRYNILLLGGDAGPDRDGLRPDSISVVSIEAATGKPTIFGLPRNLEYAPFAADSPMIAEYPEGYGVNGCNVDVCLLNSIYTEVQLMSSDLYPDAEAAGSSPGIEAMRDAAEGILGIKIQYYALIDMQGFSQLIDALGGITINSQGRYPINGDVDAAGNPIDVDGWIEPGVQVMDGYTALWYARSRYSTSDYDRMARQREVQEAVLEQFEPANVLTKFQGIAEAGAEVVKTDIPQGMLGYFVQLAGKARTQEIASVELVPPNVDPEQPDYEYVRQLASEALVLSTAP